MPEPSVEDLAHWLAPEFVPDQARADDLRHRLTELGQLKELFAVEGWEVLRTLLERNTTMDQRTLETCKLADVRSARDRIGWWRYLLNLPTQIEAEIGDLRTQLKEFELQPEEEDR